MSLRLGPLAAVLVAAVLAACSGGGSSAAISTSAAPISSPPPAPSPPPPAPAPTPPPVVALLPPPFIQLTCSPCTKIAFTTDRDGNPEIYSVFADGAGLTRLTSHLANDDEAVWSPDGQRIAFTSDRSGTQQLYVMNADGSNVVRITDVENLGWGYGPSSPTWSPDGASIAFSMASNGSTNIWRVTASGGTPSLLYSAPGLDFQPSWSLHGTQLALVSDYAAYDFVFDVYLVNADGSGLTQLTRDIFDKTDYLRPSWSPRGDKLAILITKRVGVFDYLAHVGVMTPDGSGITPLIEAATTDSGAGEGMKTSWSPDGTMIAFTSGPTLSSGKSGTTNVSWVRADGSAWGTIVTKGWSPDWQR